MRLPFLSSVDKPKSVVQMEGLSQTEPCAAGYLPTGLEKNILGNKNDFKKGSSLIPTLCWLVSLSAGLHINY